MERFDIRVLTNRRKGFPEVLHGTNGFYDNCHGNWKGLN